MNNAPLRTVIGPAGFFTLAFGSIVGSGWVMVLGDWLRSAGPGGSAAGFLAGGLVMICVALCYAELAARMPRAGGEFRYVLESFGRPLAFGVGWFLTLGLVAFTAFEGIAFAWLIETLLPTTRGAVLYQFFGHDVTTGDLVLGIGGALTFALVNHLGTAVTVGLQKVVTFTFIAVVCVIIIAGFAVGDSANLQPAFTTLDGREWMTGALWIFATAAIFLNGFQTPLYAVEERRPDVPVRKVVLAMIGGMVAAVAFYVCIILSASLAAPWAASAKADLPAAFAFGNLTRSGILHGVVLLVATISLLKSWNAYVLGSVRLLSAQAQSHMLPTVMTRMHPRYGSATVPIIVVLILNVLGVMLGRGAIVPIVNMCAIVSAGTFTLCLFLLLRLRKKSEAPQAFVAPGGLPFIGLTLLAAAAMALFALYEPWSRSKGEIPAEWLLMAGWATLGALLWLVRGRNGHTAR